MFKVCWISKCKNIENSDDFDGLDCDFDNLPPSKAELDYLHLLDHLAEKSMAKNLSDDVWNRKEKLVYEFLSLNPRRVSDFDESFVGSSKIILPCIGCVRYKFLLRKDKKLLFITDNGKLYLFLKKLYSTKILWRLYVHRIIRNAISNTPFVYYNKKLYLDISNINSIDDIDKSIGMFQGIIMKLTSDRRKI